MRGYFGIGVERISKPMNVGNLFRTAHAFGASFVFTIAADYQVQEVLSDTSKAPLHVPLYQYESVATMALPADCDLVGVELLDEATVLPSFRHPVRAAYVLGPERGELSPELVARCKFLIKIPTSFCVNVATAGAIIMYDRLLSMGRFGERPVAAGGPVAERPAHVRGRPRRRRRSG
ncbi:MAG: TrmH family RNA methyltransferase [Alphaproteobacteria bacterium]|nr:TrmH family RNA methyltransferase [Alphaproteobacteria bacterium]